MKQIQTTTDIFIVNSNHVIGHSYNCILKCNDVNNIRLDFIIKNLQVM